MSAAAAPEPAGDLRLSSEFGCPALDAAVTTVFRDLAGFFGSTSCHLEGLTGRDIGPTKAHRERMDDAFEAEGRRTAHS